MEGEGEGRFVWCSLEGKREREGRIAVKEIEE